jgi:hypothetical protein
MKDLVIADKKLDLSVFQKTAVLSDEQKKQVLEYSKIKQEIERHEKEIQKLMKIEGMINANWCRKYLWTSIDGAVTPVFLLEDSHLKNIVKYLRERGRTNTQINNEYISRFGFDDFVTEEDKYKPKYDEYYYDF